MSAPPMKPEPPVTKAEVVTARTLAARPTSVADSAPSRATDQSPSPS